MLANAGSNHGWQAQRICILAKARMTVEKACLVQLWLIPRQI